MIGVRGKIEPATPAQLREWEDWLELLDATEAKVARQWHPFTCYRDANNRRTHYVITLYGFTRDKTPLLLTLLHGADSTLPGVSVFGMSPENIAVCGCMQWQTATDEQMVHMREHFNALERARALAPTESTPSPAPGSTTKH